jgi:hypothetical protein
MKQNVLNGQQRQLNDIPVGNNSQSAAPSISRLWLFVVLLSTRVPCVSSLMTQSMPPTIRNSIGHRRIFLPSREGPRNTRETFLTLLVEANRDPIVAQEEPEVVVVNDKNGTPIEVGCVVRVAKEMEAYQVPAKGRGSYNERKEFVPIEKEASRARQNLLLPEGIRGVVIKTYNSEDISANFPVKVQFTPGENTDEGYDPPVAFIMHFDPSEIECVSQG